jgi:NTE family protein
MMFKKMKIGLALGGGGARGLAHIGVIKALEKAGIPIHIITGSSVGAVVGGMYAQSLAIADVEARIVRFFTGEDFKKTGLHLFRPDMHAENFFGQIARITDTGLIIHINRRRVSLMKQHRLAAAIDSLVGEGLIENTRIKFAPVATNLLTGEIVAFRSGSMREALKASSAIPGFLPPIEYKGLILVDGAVAASIPVEPAFALGADFVIAVNVSRSLDDEPMPENVVDILFRTNLITAQRNDVMACERAQVVIKPKVEHIHWAEFGKIHELIAVGETAGAEAVRLIQTAIKKKKGKTAKAGYEQPKPS